MQVERTRTCAALLSFWPTTTKSLYALLPYPPSLDFSAPLGVELPIDIISTFFLESEATVVFLGHEVHGVFFCVLRFLPHTTSFPLDSRPFICLDSGLVVSAYT